MAKFALLLSAFSLASCAGAQREHSAFSVSGSSPDQASSETGVRAEIASVEGQLANMDGLIANAEARMQNQGMPGGEGMAAGAQGELFSYQAQRNALEARSCNYRASFWRDSATRMRSRRLAHLEPAKKRFFTERAHKTR